MVSLGRRPRWMALCSPGPVRPGKNPDGRPQSCSLSTSRLRARSDHSVVEAEFGGPTLPCDWLGIGGGRGSGLPQGNRSGSRYRQVGTARRIGYADAGSIEQYGIELAIVLAVGDDVVTMPVCYDSPYSRG